MKKTTKKLGAFVVDAWLNLTTGLGTSRDKRVGGAASSDIITYYDALEMYRSDDMVSRIIDMPADEMVREWFDVVIPEDKEAGELLGAKLDDLNAQTVFKQAIRAQDLFGGSVILIGVNDGVIDLSRPLDMAQVRSVDFLNWFDASEVNAVEWQNNPAEANYGEPTHFDITPKTFGSGISTSSILKRVHRSRLLVLSRPIVSRTTLGRSTMGSGSGFGESVLAPLYSIIRDYGVTWASVGHLLQDFAQSVYKFSGLGDALMSGQASALNQRLEGIDRTRSVMRAVVLDKDDEFQRMATPLTGLPEIMQQFGYRIAAAAKMPVSLLLGQSPTGLNATGDSDVRWFYDHIKRRQKQEIAPLMEYLIKIIMNARVSPVNGKEPENWSLQWHELWQMTDEQKADVRLKMAQTDMIYLQNGVLSPTEVSTSRFGGDAYSIETTLAEQREIIVDPNMLPTSEPSTNANEPSPDPTAAG
jgi:phage-related protein (TIGR01555 family)